MVEVAIKYKKLIELLCRAIEERCLLKFYYESKNRNAWRVIRPYMIWPNPKGTLSLAGVPKEELKRPFDKRKSGQYLLPQLLERFENGQLEVLYETFDDPEVPKDRVANTKTDVICRFIYDDEDAKLVMKKWINVEYVLNA